MSRVLLTGATGYIGSHVAVELVNAGYDVIGVDNFSNSTPKVLDGIEKIIGKRIDFMEVDCTDYNAFEKVFEQYPDIEAAIHFAAYKAVGESVAEPVKYYRNNLDSLVNLIENLFDDKQGIFNVGNETGFATISPNVIDFKDGKIYLTCDLRVPAKMDINEFIPLLDAMAIEYNIKSYHKPHYVDVNGSLVQGLNNAYNDATGENDVPYSCSGATFASVFKSGVAFGPALRNGKSAIHEPNEFMSEESLLKMYNIYKTAIRKMCCR